jgi:hypothetical protein
LPVWVHPGVVEHQLGPHLIQQIGQRIADGGLNEPLVAYLSDLGMGLERYCCVDIACAGLAVLWLAEIVKRLSLL